MTDGPAKVIEDLHGNFIVDLNGLSLSTFFTEHEEMAHSMAEKINKALSPLVEKASLTDQLAVLLRVANGHYHEYCESGNNVPCDSCRVLKAYEKSKGDCT